MNWINLLAADYSWIVYSYIVDIIIIFLAIVMFVWYYVYQTKKEKKKKNFKYPPLDSNIKKINEDTYLIEKDKSVSDGNGVDESAAQEEIATDNAVEHFSTQISNISASINENVTSNQTSQPIVEQTAPENNENKIGNHVEFNTISKNKKPTSAYNQGTNAYGEATNFFSVLKQENVDMKTAAAKEKTAPAKRKTRTQTSPKTTAAKVESKPRKNAKTTSKTSKKI